MVVHCIALPKAAGLSYTFGAAADNDKVLERSNLYTVTPGRDYRIIAILFLENAEPRFLVRSELAVEDIPSTWLSLVASSCFSRPYPPVPAGWVLETDLNVPPFKASIGPRELGNVPDLLAHLATGDPAAAKLVKTMIDA
jgi:hypothetical protein